MKKSSAMILTLLLCILFIGCSNQSSKRDLPSYNPPPSNTSQGDNPKNNLPPQQNNTTENNQTTDTNGPDSLPEYKAPDSDSQQTAGTLEVNVNGADKSYSSVCPLDNKGLNGSWTALFGSRDTIYITLPFDVKSGEEFTQEDARTTMASFSPPSFSFTYTDKSGRSYSVGDGTNYYDSFGLIVDKVGGRGGYLEGRFAAEIRPLGTDSIIMKNGRFKIKIKE